MGVPPKVVARMIVIPWLGSLALNIVLARAHRIAANKKADATEYPDFGIQSRRLTR
jgi:hypothetical protein